MATHARNDLLKLERRQQRFRADRRPHPRPDCWVQTEARWQLEQLAREYPAQVKHLLEYEMKDRTRTGNERIKAMRARRELANAKV